MANYPTSLDSLTNPSAGDTTAGVDHASQHATVNDIVEQLEAKLGISASTPTSGKLLRGTGVGSSAWDKDAPTGTIVGTTDSQTLTNKTLTSPTINTAIINNPTLKTDTIAEFTAAAGVTIDGLLIKDSKLATNNSVVTANITDDAVTAAKVDWASTGANGGIWWEELVRATPSAGAVDTGTFSARKYLMVIITIVSSGGTVSHRVRFNGDTASNYASKYSTDNSALTNSASDTSIIFGTTAVDSGGNGVMLISNTTALEKNYSYTGTTNSTTGAANTPTEVSTAGKWANTASQITRIQLYNTGTGTYGTGTEVVVLGHN